MKKVWLIATALAMVGCKKEATPAPSTAAPTAAATPVPANAGGSIAKPLAAPVSPPVPANSTPATPGQPPQVDRKEKAKAELERMLAEWQAGEMPKEFVDVALLFTHGGVTDKLLEYKVNAVIAMPPPGRNFRGTINLTVERRPIKQVQFILTEDDNGKWKARVGE